MINRLLSGAAVLLVRFYQKVISPLLPQSCIYHPSCSAYMIEALKKHGFFKGLFMGVLRIGRCNSLFKGGWDPVAESWNWREEFSKYSLFRRKKGD